MKQFEELLEDLKKERDLIIAKLEQLNSTINKVADKLSKVE